MFRPIVWIAAVFATGIACARASPIAVDAWVLAGLALVAAAGLLLVFHLSAAVPLLCAVACAGAILYIHEARPPPDDHLLSLDRQHVAMIGVVTRPPQLRPGRMRLVVAPERVTSRAGTIARPRGRVLVILRGRPTVRYGDRVDVGGRLLRPPAAGNPGEFSYRDHLAAEGIKALLAPGRSGTFKILGHGHGQRLLAAVFAARERVLAVFAKALPGRRGALLASLLLGDDGAIEPEMTEAFKRAGLLHVLVVSGAQVGLVMASVVWLGRLFRQPPAVIATLAGGAVVAFALMAGWVPSVARAAVMAVVAAVAMAWARSYDATAALSLAGVILLSSSPLLLFDPGYQLSFVATWALLYIAPVLHTRLPGPQGLRTLVSMTIAAQVAVLPVLAFHFQQVSLTGFIANLLVVPVVAMLVPAGFVISVIGLLVPEGAGIVAWPLRPLLDAVAYLAQLFSALPGAAVPIYPHGLPAVAVFFLLIAVVVEWQHGRLRLRRETVLAAGTCVLAVVVWVRVAAAGPSLLTITALDVGQGDALVIRGPSGQTLLIDGGGHVEGRHSHLTDYDVGERRVVPALRRMRVRSIDVIMLTHPHEDHVGGLIAVLKNFSVGLVLDSGLAHPSPSYARFRQLIDARGIPYVLARRGMQLDLGDRMGMIVLLPQEPLITGSGSDPNLNSVVARLTYGRVAALFTGDMEALNESQLLDLGDDVRSAVLKVAHHGSGTGTTEAFVDAVRPVVAVISVGPFNPFGHPDPDTLAVLEERGASVYRTDEHGAVIIETDGRRVRVRTIRH